MLKLIKYDFIELNKRIWLLYAAGIGCGLLVQLSSPLVNTRFDWVNGLFSISGVLLAAGILIGLLIFSWLAFKNHMFGKPAYLHHTFPVSLSATVGAWMISSLLTNAIGVAAALAALYLSTSYEDFYIDLFRNLSDYLNPWILFLCLFLSQVLKSTFEIFCGYAGMIIGFRKPGSKLGWSLLWGLVFYFAGSAALLGVISLFVESGIGMSIRENIPDFLDQLSRLIYFTMAVYAVLTGSLAWFGCWRMNQGVDLE